MPTDRSPSHTNCNPANADAINNIPETSIAVPSQSHNGIEELQTVLSNANLIRVANDAGERTEYLEKLYRTEKELRADELEELRRQHKCRKEMYFAVNIYFVMQGVFYSGVAQAEIVSCKDVWAPMIISLIFTVGFIAAFIHQIKEYNNSEHSREDLLKEQRSTYNSIRNVIEPGVIVLQQDESPVSGLFSWSQLGAIFLVSGFGLLVICSFPVMLCTSLGISSCSA